MSISSKKRKRDCPNPGYVKTELCRERHEGLSKEMGEMAAELKLLRRALVGDDLQGGLVKKVGELGSQFKAGKTVLDWVKPIVISFLSAGGLALFLKVLGVLH